MQPQLLLLDADDTLWENNIYFERVIDEFIEFVNHQHYSREQVRAILNDIERANAALHGYGSETFGRNLREAYQKLAAGPVAEEQLDYLSGLARSIAEQELEIIEGVAETLEYLARRGHRLVVLTKGSEEEQHAKISRSGLGLYFSDARVVREKDAAAYRSVVKQLCGEPEGTWMIGNSPKSDINPALEAGLNAVFIPHSNTWVLENEELQQGRGKLVMLRRFADLRSLF